jgi:transposase
MLTPDSWPTDPRECHGLLDRLSQQVEDLQAALDQAAKLHDQSVQEHEQAVEELRRQLDLYRRFVFGPRRERLVEAPGQGHLFEFDGVESVALPPARDPGAPKRPRQSRKLDYDRLPQIRIPHDVPEAEKLCTHCGEAKACIGEDEARVLQFIPAHFDFRSTSCPSTPALTAAMVWYPLRALRVP